MLCVISSTRKDPCHVNLLEMTSHLHLICLQTLFRWKIVWNWSPTICWYEDEDGDF